MKITNKSDTLLAVPSTSKNNKTDALLGVPSTSKNNKTDALLAVPSTSKNNKTDALLAVPSTSINNKTDDWLVSPSTSKEDFLDNHVNQIAEVNQLNLMYEDFSYSMDQSHDQEIVELDPSVHFSTVNGKQLPL